MILTSIRDIFPDSLSLQTVNSEHKWSADNHGRDFDERLFGHWSIGFFLNLGNSDSFQATREQSQKRAT